MASGPFDVFLSHNSLDKPLVEELAHRLVGAGIQPWLDKWELTPGTPWLRNIQAALSSVRTVAICIGPHGMGGVHTPEAELAIQTVFEDTSKLAIPVLLPGGKKELVEGFLGRFTWVDLGDDWEHGFRALCDAILRRKTGAPITLPGKSPYRGLESFTEEHSRHFFGRDNDVARVLESLRQGTQMLVTTGPSGVGKSSFMKAGLLPAIRSGQFNGSHEWQVVQFRPGAKPCRQLALRLAQIVGEAPAAVEWLERELAAQPRFLRDAIDLFFARFEKAPVVLFAIDQLEEIYTHSAEDQYRSFIAAVCYACSTPDGNVKVFATLRADFVGRFLESEPLARGGRLWFDTYVLLGLSGAGLKDAIRRPAWQNGVEVDTALVDHLTDEVEKYPGSLPLLQLTLDELWRLRDGRRITWESYATQLGGLRDVLTRRANAVLDLLGEEGRTVAWDLFARLIEPGDGTPDTRLVASRHDLVGADTRREAVLDQLITARLLTAHEHDVELAHEALITQWPRLRQWVDANRGTLRVVRDIRREASVWAHDGKLADNLWRGARLQRASEMVAASGLRLVSLEREFLDASLAAEQNVRSEGERQRLRELQAARALLQAERRSARRMRYVFAITSVAAVVFAVLMLNWAESTRDAVQRRRQAALILARSQMAAMPLDAIGALQNFPEYPRWLRWIRPPNDDSEPLRLVASAAVRQGVPRTMVDLFPTAVIAAGDRFAVGTKHGRILLIDSSLGYRLFRSSGEAVDALARVSANQFVSVGASGSVDLWDKMTGAQTHLGRISPPVERSSFTAITSADGELLVVANDNSAALDVWRIADRTHSKLTIPQGNVWRVAITTNHVVASDGHGGLHSWPRARLNDSDAFRVRLKGKWIRDIALSGDDDVLVVLVSPELMTTFTPDQLAKQESEAVLLWKVGTQQGASMDLGECDNPSQIHTIGGRTVIAWSDEADQICTMAWNSAEPASVHRIAIPRLSESSFFPQNPAPAVAGHVFAIPSSYPDSVVVVWNLKETPKSLLLRGHSQAVAALAILDDGKVLGTAGRDGTFRTWALSDMGRAESVPPLDLRRFPLNLIPARRLAERAVPPQTHREFPSVSFNRSDYLFKERVPVGMEGGDLVLFRSGGDFRELVDTSFATWHIDEPKARFYRGHGDWVTSVAVSRDRKRLVSGSLDKTIRIWQSEASSQVLDKLQGGVWSLAWSDSNEYLAAADDTGAIVIYAIGSGAATRTAQTSIDNVKKTASLNEACRTAGALTFVARRQVVAFACANQVILWSFRSGAIHVLNGPRESIYQIESSHADGHIYGVGEDRSVWHWSPDSDMGSSTGQVVAKHRLAVSAVATHPTRSVIASIDDEGILHLVDRLSGFETTEKIEGASHPVALKFDPRARALRIVTNDGTVVTIPDPLPREIRELRSTIAEYLPKTSRPHR